MICSTGRLSPHLPDRPFSSSCNGGQKDLQVWFFKAHLPNALKQLKPRQACNKFGAQSVTAGLTIGQLNYLIVLTCVNCLFHAIFSRTRYLCMGFGSKSCINAFIMFYDGLCFGMLRSAVQICCSYRHNRSSMQGTSQSHLTLLDIYIYYIYTPYICTVTNIMCLPGTTVSLHH